MQEMLEYFRVINDFHWGANWYQWLFYAGIVLIIIFERDRIAKSVFGWFPVLFLIGIFNPLFYRAIFFVWDTPYAYYARMFSFIPLLFCIAIGFMQLVKKVKWEWAKLIVVCAVSALIIVGGDNFYRAPWMAKVSNIEKIPEGAAEVVDLLKQEDHVISIAVADPLNIYIRQINADFITPYGRYMNDLGTELSKEVPDVQYVMKEAGKQAVDYIVVHNNADCKENFKKSGYNPYAETEEYLIYSVTGVPYTKRSYNEKCQIIAETSCDEKGNPIENNLGYATVTYEYDNNGLIAKESFWDRERKNIELYGKYTSFQNTYWPISKLLKSTKYLNESDQPILVLGRYETRYKYGKDKKLINESYYNQYGQPMNRTDTLYASKILLYDNQGRLTGEQFFNVDGKPTISFFGYASHTMEYDQNNNIVREEYYGVDGQAITVSGGFASIERTFADDGKLTSETYFDENGVINACRNGYCSVVYSYDERSIRQDFYDSNGNPIVSSCGYAAFECELNDEGGLESVTYYGTHGEVLGSIDKNGSTIKKMFKFSHPSEGTYVLHDGTIDMETIVPENSFDATYFLLYDAVTNKYLLLFGNETGEGEFAGEYIHNLPSGLYIIRFKANGSTADNWIQCIEYINDGDVIHYVYSVDEFKDDHIVVNKLQMHIE